MDPAYRNWLWLLLAGIVLGLFVRPRTVGVAFASLFVVALLGLVTSAALSHSNHAMLFGIAAMAIPIVGALAAIGAVAGSALRSAFRRHGQK